MHVGNRLQLIDGRHRLPHTKRRDDRHETGLRYDLEEITRLLVVQIERADPSIRLFEHREFARPVVSSDFHYNSGATDTHRCDRRFNPHVSELRRVSGDERDGSLYQA